MPARPALAGVARPGRRRAVETNMAEIVELSSAGEERRDRSKPWRNGAGALRTDEIYVLFTSLDETLAAVRVAKRLAVALGSGVTLVHLRAVPWGAPVEEPSGRSPLEADGVVERLAAEDVGVHVKVYLCRDARRAVSSAFKGRSLIVIGGRRHWWPTRSDRWRRTLEAEGHLVICVDEANHA
jgi:hypothetical protein